MGFPSFHSIFSSPNPALLEVSTTLIKSNKLTAWSCWRPSLISQCFMSCWAVGSEMGGFKLSAKLWEAQWCKHVAEPSEAPGFFRWWFICDNMHQIYRSWLLLIKHHRILMDVLKHCFYLERSKHVVEHEFWFCSTICIINIYISFHFQSKFSSVFFSVQKNGMGQNRCVYFYYDLYDILSQFV